jgi:ATP-binding cassette, subfamily B, bacterial PglK
MIRYVNKIIYLLNGSVKEVPYLLLIFLIMSVLDVLGIALIIPYVDLITSSNFPETGNIFIKLLTKYSLISTDDIDSVVVFISKILILIFLIKAIVAIYINYRIIKFGQDNQVRLKIDLMKSYQNLPYNDYLNRNSSEYIYNIQTLAGHFSNQVLMPGLRLISDSIVTVAILLVLAFQNISALMLLLTILFGFIILFDMVFRKKIKQYGVDSNIVSTSLIRGINEGIEGLKEIRILGNEKFFLRKVKNNSRIFSSLQIKSQFLGSLPKYLMELLLILFIVSIVVLTISSGKEFDSIITTLSLFGVASIRLLPAANSISNSITKLRYGKDAIDRLFLDIRQFKSMNEQRKTSVKPNSESFIFNNISLKLVSFGYNNLSKNVLNDISISIKKGDSIGIIGPSGSGKSTLIDILLGLHKPTNGKVLINNKDLSLNISNWRSMVAYLPQQAFLVDGTIAENIALGEDNINTSNVFNSLKNASMESYVKELPDGIDTIIGERGTRLSGGQRQRIVLARSFYFKKEVLIMDESTSALDSETEKEITTEIKRLKGAKTIVVISHRMSTVEHCDRIYKIDKGRVTSFGTPKEILPQQNNK